MRARPDSGWWVVVRWERIRRDRLFHFVHDLFRFLRASMNEEPARAHWNPTPEENDYQAEDRADSKSETPAEPDG